MSFTISLPRSGGGSSAPRNGLEVSILDHGGKSDDGTTDNVAPYNAAVTALRTLQGANPSNKLGWIYFPGAARNYATSMPLSIEYPNIGIRGDRGSTQILNTGWGAVVSLGFRQTEPGPGNTIIQLDSSYRPDAFQKLDASMVTGINQRAGIRGNGNASVVWSGTPFDRGQQSPTFGSQVLDNWGELNRFSFEIVFERGGGVPWTGALVENLIAFGGYNSSTIFQFQHGGSSGLFSVLFTDSAGNLSTLGFQLSTTAIIHKLSVQIDLVAKTAQVYYGPDSATPTQIAVTIAGGAFGGGGSGQWMANERDCMIFYVTNGDGRAPLVTPGTPLTDATIYGLSFGNALRYQNNGIGTPQVRLDSATLNDASRFNLNDGSIFAMLWGELPSAGTDRKVRGFSPGTFKLCFGRLMQAGQYQSLGGQINNKLDGLILTMADARVGPVVEMGPLLHFGIRDCSLLNGIDGLLQVPTLATYDVILQNLHISATNYGISNAMTVIRAREITFDNSGRSMGMSWQSNFYIDGWSGEQVNAQARAIWTIRSGNYGGDHHISNGYFDDEGSGILSAPFDLQHGGALVTDVDIDGAYLGAAAMGREIFKLRTLPETTAPAVFRARNVNAGTILGYVRPGTVDSALWSGNSIVTPQNGAGWAPAVGYVGPVNLSEQSPATP